MLTGSYRTSIEDEVGKDTTVANSLAGKLERLLWAKLPYFSSPLTEQQEPSQKEYNSKEGPVLRDGKRYTTEQMLDMSAIEFLYLHHKAKLPEPVVLASVTRYTKHLLENRFGIGLGDMKYNQERMPSKDQRDLYPKMSEIIDFDTEEAVNIIPNRRSAPRLAQVKVVNANKFFVDNYGISIGKN